MIIALGADHRGYILKEYLKQKTLFGSVSVTWLDLGAFDAERSDYPVFAKSVSQAVLAGKADCGILLCGTGVGMAIAANRFKGIFAAVAWNESIARASKEDDNSNILVLPADDLSEEQTQRIVSAWLSAHFHEGRYRERVTQIDQLG
jgi:ribose 5-phosphate isomerase B